MLLVISHYNVHNNDILHAIKDWQRVQRNIYHGAYETLNSFTIKQDIARINQIDDAMAGS
jgi:hypothetical protein